MFQIYFRILIRYSKFFQRLQLPPKFLYVTQGIFDEYKARYTTTGGLDAALTAKPRGVEPYYRGLHELVLTPEERRKTLTEYKNAKQGSQLQGKWDEINSKSNLNKNYLSR